ncbi:hypothetical protein DPMN_092373 [Dreissena polymorpha]|uniref:Uncharacterized protein n=1 Tax=Dreissena polymorpha TaxID=45954 RepID=A0A9D4L1E5_DREPO|nr:hypothetical protein DPMN_092373 [Dreissena polymorpha]
MMMYPHEPSLPARTAPAATRNQHGLSRTNTTEIRIAQDKYGPTRHLHGPSRTYTTTTRIHAAARLKSKRCRHRRPGARISVT